MRYIVHRRFRHKCICGEVNLPAMTECESIGDMIRWDGKDICVIYSFNAHQYFARNNDGSGMLRGRLTQAIQKALERRDKDYQNRWDKIWKDDISKQYKRPERPDYWLWNHDFYNAPIDDLQHIASLIGCVVKRQ